MNVISPTCCQEVKALNEGTSESRNAPKLSRISWTQNGSEVILQGSHHKGMNEVILEAGTDGRSYRRRHSLCDAAVSRASGSGTSSQSDRRRSCIALDAEPTSQMFVI